MSTQQHRNGRHIRYHDMARAFGVLSREDGPREGFVGVCTVSVADDGRELPEHIRRALATAFRLQTEQL